jgi:glutathione S-transferase
LRVTVQLATGAKERTGVKIGQPFLMSERPTLADGIFVGVARWLDFHQIADPARWPKLAGLRRRIEADPALIYATALERGDTGSETGACVSHIPLADVIERFGA